MAEAEKKAEGGALESFISLLMVIGLGFFLNWLLCSDPTSYKCTVCGGKGGIKIYGVFTDCNGCGGDGNVEEGDKLWQTKGKLH